MMEQHSLMVGNPEGAVAVVVPDRTSCNCGAVVFKATQSADGPNLHMRTSTGDLQNTLAVE